MAPKPTIQRYFSILLITGLVACGRQADHVTPTPDLTAVDRTAEAAAFQTAAVQTVKAMPTFGPAATNTQAQSFLPTVSFSDWTPGSFLTSTPFPTKTPSSATPHPAHTPLPFAPLDGLRVAYGNGNIYVQDSGNPDMQLTNSGHYESHPLLSDDGQKIAFYRGGDELWVIGVDGTGEQMLVSPELLSAFGEIYKNEFIELYKLVFLPGTHQLIFNTWIYPRMSGEVHPQFNQDLFFVDADTGELKQFKAPRQGGVFLPAPNGKWIAVETLDHIEVINNQGQSIYDALVTYPLFDDYYGLTWAPMYWTQDSRKLIVVQPAIFDEFRGVYTIARSVWRYSMDTGEGIETRLSPPPMNNALRISPDGNWIVYGYQLGDTRTAEPGVYLGNLHNGTSQLIYTVPVDQTGYREVPDVYDEWSPDSVHFIFRDTLGYRMFIGNIHGKITPLGYGTGILGWIDNDHYLFEGGDVIGKVGVQDRVNVMGSYPYYEVAGYEDDTVSFVFLKR